MPGVEPNQTFRKMTLFYSNEVGSDPSLGICEDGLFCTVLARLSAMKAVLPGTDRRQRPAWLRAGRPRSSAAPRSSRPRPARTADTGDPRPSSRPDSWREAPRPPAPAPAQMSAAASRARRSLQRAAADSTAAPPRRTGRCSA